MINLGGSAAEAGTAVNADSGTAISGVDPAKHIVILYGELNRHMFRRTRLDSWNARGGERHAQQDLRGEFWIGFGGDGCVGVLDPGH